VTLCRLPGLGSSLGLRAPTWKINTVRLREPIVHRLLREESPDMLCLQEIKTPVALLPRDGFAVGYTHGVVA
jgi:exodeoxyribonuclease-3